MFKIRNILVAVLHFPSVTHTHTNANTHDNPHNCHTYQSHRIGRKCKIVETTSNKCFRRFILFPQILSSKTNAVNIHHVYFLSFLFFVSACNFTLYGLFSSTFYATFSAKLTVEFGKVRRKETQRSAQKKKEKKEKKKIRGSSIVSDEGTNEFFYTALIKKRSVGRG